MSMARKQERLSTEELHQVKQLMGAQLAILSIWSLASLDMNSGLLLFLASMTSWCVLLFPKWVARIPSQVWPWGGPVMLLVIGVDFVLHGLDFMEPLVRMVVMLVMYRLLVPRNHREDLQVILLCLFCVVISGVLTVSLLFALQIILFAPLAMVLLFVISLLDRGQDAVPHVVQWESFQWSQLIRRVWRVLDVRVLFLCSALFALVVIVSSVLFILMPRFDLNRAIPFLELKATARSGFSENVSLGEVSEIQEDDSVALSIDVPSLESVNVSPYWRMLVLDKYDAGRFRVSPSLLARPLRSFEQTREKRSSVVPNAERQGALWTFYMEGGISRYLPLPGDFVAMRFQKYQDLEVIPSTHVIALDSVGQKLFSYQVEDLKFNQRFTATEEERALLKSMPLEVESQPGLAYPLTTLELSLSPDSLKTLEGINRSIVADEPVSAVAYSQVATDYLWKHFAYSLNPNGARANEEDPVVSWLLHGSQGHCELFAGSFILLARAQGFPARMVVGYAGGSWNSVEDYFVVRNSDAHAWAEIYDAESQTWLRVDPTPGSGSSDPEVLAPRDMPIESDWAAWVDSLRILWYRRVINFEQRDQVELARSLKESYAEFKQRLNEFRLSFQAWMARPLHDKNMQPVLLGVFLLGSSYLVWRLRYQLLGILFRILRRPKALDPVRRQASRYLQRLQARELNPEVVAELQALRFGPAVSAQQVKAVFARARRALK
jgi:hypothetical protein